MSCGRSRSFDYAFCGSFAQDDTVLKGSEKVNTLHTRLDDAVLKGLEEVNTLHTPSLDDMVLLNPAGCTLLTLSQIRLTKPLIKAVLAV